MNKRIKLIIKNRQQLESIHDDFAREHGFRCKRSQDFKNCILIQWKQGGKKYSINYPRIEEYVALCHKLYYKHKLQNDLNDFGDEELSLTKIGIYCFYEWGHKSWAIPNKYKKIQRCVLKQLPKWVQVTEKKLAVQEDL